MAQSPILVTDEPPTELDIGKLIAADLRAKRIARIGDWAEQGHITIDANHTLNEYTVRIDQQYFAEPKDEFPSVGLIANIALAINAGQSDSRRVTIKDFRASDMLQYSRLGERRYVDKAWMDEIYAGHFHLRPTKKALKVQP